MKLPDKVYNVLKWIALVCLPTLSTFYSILAGIWNLPYAERIPRTITAIGLLIGALIGVSHISIKREERNNENIE